MNKTKMFTIALMTLCIGGLVTAGLVNYLSNTSDVEMTVSSPIQVSELTGDDLSGVYGGETRVVSGSLENLADAQIKGKLKIVISNDEISLDDFETLTAGIVEYVDELEVYSVSGVDMKTTGPFVGSIDDSVAGELTFITTERTFEITETWDAEISLGFKSNVVGDYNIEVTVIPL